MDPGIRPRVARVHERPDPRDPRGRRHPRAAILAWLCGAMRCGVRSDGARAEWGHGYGQPLAQAWGCTQAKTPCAATASRGLRPRDGNLGDAALGLWVASVL